jgi:hypothetical protein
VQASYSFKLLNGINRFCFIVLFKKLINIEKAVQHLPHSTLHILNFSAILNLKFILYFNIISRYCQCKFKIVLFFNNGSEWIKLDLEQKELTCSKNIENICFLGCSFNETSGSYKPMITYSEGFYFLKTVEN